MTTKEIEQLVREHSSYLLNRAYSLLSVKEDAEDLVQEVFVAICQPTASFAERSSVRTWLTAILNHKIADFYKKRYKGVKVDFDGVFNEHGEWSDSESLEKWDSQEKSTDSEEFTQTLENCMEKLPRHWKIVVGQTYFSETKSSQICTELNLSNTNYWKILQRSRIQLKQCLDMNWFNSL